MPEIYLGAIKKKIQYGTNHKVIPKYGIRNIKEVLMSEIKNLNEAEMIIDNKDDAENLSGYYRINARLTYEGLDGYVTFHRGKGLPEIFEEEGINNLLFSEATKKDIESEKEYVYAQSILYDIFTQEEVDEVIKDVYPQIMDISINPVLTNSINDYMSVSCLSYDGHPKPCQQTRMEPSNSDKYFLTLRWYDEPVSE